MRFTLCLLIVLGIPVIGSTQETGKTEVNSKQPQALSLGSTVSLSYSQLPQLLKEKNERVKAARVKIEAEQERTGHFGRSFLPHVSAELGAEDFKSGSEPSRRQEYWRLGASVNIYRGGRDRLDEDIRLNQVEIAKVDSNREFSQELKRAQIAYWELVAIEKLIGFRREELKRNEENFKSARRRAGAGIATTADAVQFELHRSTLEQGIRQLELRRDLNRNRLAVALGLDNHENLTVETEFPQLEVKELESLKVESQLDVKSLRIREEVESLQAKQAGRWWQPKVDLYASYGLPSLSDELERAIRKDREIVAGVRLSLDLGEGINERKESQARSLEAKVTGLRAAYKARETIAVDHELRHDISVTAKLIADNQKNIETAREFLKLTQGEYSRGLKNGPDLLSAFRQLYELQERSVELTQELLSTRAELESLNERGEALP